MKTYRGFTLHRGRSYQDWRVEFPGRARWGTLPEVRADVDAYLSCTLKSQRERIDIEQIFRDFIYNHHGKQVLMSLAKEIDAKTGRENDYTQFVDIEYEED